MPKQAEGPDDLLANDFPGLAIDGHFLDQEDRKRINKQVAHLTHVSLQQAEHSYRYREFLSAALPRVRQFCRYSETRADADRQLAAFVRATLQVIQHVEKTYTKRN